MSALRTDGFGAVDYSLGERRLQRHAAALRTVPDVRPQGRVDTIVRDDENGAPARELSVHRAAKPLGYYIAMSILLPLALLCMAGQAYWISLKVRWLTGL
jgi:hypothetical protein